MKYLKIIPLLLFLMITLPVAVSAQAAPPPPPSKPQQTPIDGGLALLAAAGGGYAIRKLRSRSRK